MSSSDAVKTYVAEQTSPEEDLSNCSCGGAFLTATQDFTDRDDGYNVYWPDGHDTPKEYAVYGWFKMNEAVSGTDEQILFRFTTNEDADLGDADNLGDRTLVVSVKKDYVVFSSYTYDILK